MRNAAIILVLLSAAAVWFTWQGPRCTAADHGPAIGSVIKIGGC